MAFKFDSLAMSPEWNRESRKYWVWWPIKSITWSGSAKLQKWIQDVIWWFPNNRNLLIIWWFCNQNWLYSERWTTVGIVYVLGLAYTNKDAELMAWRQTLIDHRGIANRFADTLIGVNWTSVWSAWNFGGMLRFVKGRDNVEFLGEVEFQAWVFFGVTWSIRLVDIANDRGCSNSAWRSQYFRQKRIWISQV